MKTFQERIFEELEEAVKKAGCEAVIQHVYANTGTILIYKKNPAFGAGPLLQVARAYFDIQSGTSKIAFNGAPSLEPTNYPLFVFYFEPHEDTKINAMFKRWGKLLQEGVRYHKPVEPFRGNEPVKAAEAPGARAAREQREAGITR